MTFYRSSPQGDRHIWKAGMIVPTDERTFLSERITSFSRACLRLGQSELGPLRVHYWVHWISVCTCCPLPHALETDFMLATLTTHSCTQPCREVNLTTLNCWWNASLINKFVRQRQTAQKSHNTAWMFSVGIFPLHMQVQHVERSNNQTRIRIFLIAVKLVLETYNICLHAHLH